jgi:hypothetical protein
MYGLQAKYWGDWNLRYPYKRNANSSKLINQTISSDQRKTNDRMTSNDAQQIEGPCINMTTDQDASQS